MHNMIPNWSLAEWITIGMFGGVALAAWKYDAWRHENGYVDLNQSDAGNPITPNPQALVAENIDKQEESEDEK